MGCGQATQDDSGSGADSVLYIPRNDLATSNELKMANGKTFIVKQLPMLDSTVVNVQVFVAGFSDDTLMFDFGQLDPVLSIHTEDLDNDSYPELYVVTQTPDPEAFGTLYGLYSSGNDTLSMISFEGATPYTMKEGEPYSGYRGGDKFLFEGGKLTNTISVYKPDDEDGMPTGGTRTIEYELTKGPSAVRLWSKRKK